MFCAKGDKGDKVEYWQLRMLRLGADLGSWGADGSYGNATKAAVASLVPGSTGEEIGPAEAEHIDAVTTGTGTPTIDYDVLDGRYVQQGDHTINLE